MTQRKERMLILASSPCDTNLRADGPQTVDEAKKLGRQMCPKYTECSNGHLTEERQCVMLNGTQVAREAHKCRTSVKHEMIEFTQDGPKPTEWIWTDDGKSFVTLNYRDGLAKVAEFAQLQVGDREDEVGSSFEDVMKHVTSPTGVIDAMALQQLEGRFGHNGGRGCDVREGPCSCGAWH